MCQSVSRTGWDGERERERERERKRARAKENLLPIDCYSSVHWWLRFLSLSHLPMCSHECRQKWVAQFCERYRDGGESRVYGHYHCFGVSPSLLNEWNLIECSASLRHRPDHRHHIQRIGADSAVSDSDQCGPSCCVVLCVMCKQQKNYRISAHFLLNKSPTL